MKNQVKRAKKVEKEIISMVVLMAQESMCPDSYDKFCQSMDYMAGELVSKLIYSLCDYSGAWAAPYASAGYEVVQIDLKHGQDVRLLLKPTMPVYGVLAAPPCTVFAGSGAKWRALRPTSEVLEGLSIIDSCLRFVYAVQPQFWALENPTGWLIDYIGKPKMYFNPCDYGDPYTKKTCLWGNFNEPEKRPVEPREGSKTHLKYGGRSEHTKTMRSITPEGFAEAFYKANT